MLSESLEDKNPRDREGWTPLHSAAQNGHVEVCRLILDGLAWDRRNPVDRDGYSPLRLAAEQGRLEVLRLLQEESAVEEPAAAAAMQQLGRWEPYVELILKKKNF